MKNIILRGSAAQTILQIIDMAILFIMLPIMLNSLGKQAYGLWVVVLSLMPYLSRFAGRLTMAVQRFISASPGQNHKHDLCVIATNGFIIFCALGFLIFVVSVLIGIFGSSLAGDSDADEFRNLVIIFGLRLAIGLPAFTFVAVLISYMRHDIKALVEFVTVAIRTVLLLLVLKYSPSIIWLAWVYFITEIAAQITFVLVTYKMFPELKIDFSLKEWAVMKKLGEFTIFSGIASFGEQLRGSAHNFIVVNKLGSASVAFISIPFMLITYANQLIHTILNICIPLLTQHHAADKQKQFRDIFNLTLDLSLWMGSLMGLGLLLLGDDLLNLWIGDLVSESKSLLEIFPYFLMIFTTFLPLQYLFTVFNKQQVFAKLTWLEGILVAVSEYFLLTQYGLKGIPLGLVLPVILTRGIILPWISYKMLGTHQKVLQKHLVRTFLITTLTVIIFSIWPITTIVTTNTWLELIMVSVLFTIVYSLLFLLLFATKTTRQRLLVY